MATSIMCCVAFCFVCWILLLKAEIDSLKNEVERLKAALKPDPRDTGRNFNVSPGGSPRGQKHGE